jgi:hypothetical protein
MAHSHSSGSGALLHGDQFGAASAAPNHLRTPSQEEIVPVYLDVEYGAIYSTSTVSGVQA